MTGTMATGGQERFRLVWSDVDNFIQSMLASRKHHLAKTHAISGLRSNQTALEMNHLIQDGSFQRGCIVRLKQFTQQEVKGKKYVRGSGC